MDYNDLNILLKRPLKDGSRYDHYFKNSSCKPSYLGKSDTAFTVRQMQKWVYKNVNHTKALAFGEFANKSLARICNDVHSFLFNHVQYELDKEDQHLKSPQCTWATKEQGTDCKSYSIFASTILCNLGIKHFLRRVKQPNPNFKQTGEGIDPSLWSHVYVVVPKNQQSLRAENPNEYYIIDATVEGNREGPFTTKHDTRMTKVSLKHYGLQAPANGLRGCSCTSIKTPTAAPSPTTKVSSTTLIKRPSPVRTTTTTREPSSTEALKLLQNKMMAKEAAMYGGIRSPYMPFPYGLGNSGSSGSQQGADYASAAIALYQAGQSGAAQNQAAISTGSREQRLDAIGKSGATSSIIYGAAGATAAFTYGITALLALVPAEWYENKIGQLFEGWDCIGSSWTPKTGKQAFTIEAEFIKNRAIQTVHSFQGKTLAEVEALINQFWEYFYNVQSGSRRWLADSAKDCTKRGLQVIVTSIDEFKKQEIEPLFLQTVSASGHFLEKNGTKKVTYAQNPDNGYPGGHPPFKIDVPQYKIRVNQALLAPEEAQAEQQFQKTVVKKKTNNAIGIAAMAGLAFLAI